MTLTEILQDIHALQEDLLAYERKYNTLSNTFYESYIEGEEPPDDARVLDWTGWAGTYQILQRRYQQYAEQSGVTEQNMSRIKNLQSSITIVNQDAQTRPADMKVYSQDTRRILHEARQEYIELLNGGYTREQAIEDFWDAQAAISQYLPK